MNLFSSHTQVCRSQKGLGEANDFHTWEMSSASPAFPDSTSLCSQCSFPEKELGMLSLSLLHVL